MNHIRLNCIIGLFACTGMLASCKPRREQSSRVKDLNAGQAMNDNNNSLTEMKTGRKVVVIYYANDTFAPRRTDPAYENLDDLTRLLEGAASQEADPAAAEQLRKLASRLNHDWDQFSEIVQGDVNSLSSRLCSAVGDNYKDSVGGLAVFRNSAALNASQDANSSPTMRYMRNLSWYSCRPGEKSFHQHSLSVPLFNEFPYDSQPFSNSASFEMALKSVKTEFEPQKHRFILITKSHGSKENALVPHLSVDLREKIRKEPKTVLEAIKLGANATTGLDSWKADTILDSVDGLLKSKFDSSREKGISKIEYLRILNSLGQVAITAGPPPDAPMIFPIVLMESCKSDLQFSQNNEIREVLDYYQEGYKGFKMFNVGLLYASDEKGLKYDDVKYGDLLGFMSNGATDFQDLFKKLLDSKSQKGIKK